MLKPGIGCLLLSLLLAGCASVPTHTPVPPELWGLAVPAGWPAVRFTLAGEDRAMLEAIVTDAIASAPGDARDVSLLAISGGGERGAFTAGLLNGWTERGDRPQFRVVCGISIGALIAPLAFAGPEMDGRMRDAVAHARNRDTFRLRSLFALWNSDSVADSAPLARSLEKMIDADVIADVARGHAEGRRLLIVTTDLDAQRVVVWDAGAIAASPHPDAPALFRRVLLASAAIPVAYPPQYFAVDAGGRRFDEMHVDGGVLTQVVLPLPAAQAVAADHDIRVWLIMNMKLAVEPMDLQPRILTIASRSYQAVQLHQAWADTTAIRAAALAAGDEFQIACIPDDFNLSLGRGQGLDPEFVRALYDCGRELARNGTAFQATIPGAADPGATATAIVGRAN